VEDLLLARRTLRVRRPPSRESPDVARARPLPLAFEITRPHSCTGRRLPGADAFVRRNHDSPFRRFLAVLATLALAGCGYNDLQRQDEGIKAAWSEVLNQYQRRADLVPNLVNTSRATPRRKKRC
jgi:hypothetical protein